MWISPNIRIVDLQIDIHMHMQTVKVAVMPPLVDAGPNVRVGVRQYGKQFSVGTMYKLLDECGKEQVTYLGETFGKFKQWNGLDTLFGFSTMIDCLLIVENIEWALAVLCVLFAIILKKMPSMFFRIARMQYHFGCQ
ncbi:unnamed protein product [Lathyrus oleraceus]